MDCVGNFADNNGASLVDLFLGEKRVALAAVATVRAGAWGRAFNACAGRDLEVSQAFLDGALPAHVTVLIRLDGNAELISKISKVVHAAQVRFCVPSNI